MTMKFHPVADIFPMLPEQELQNLADDIKANGLKTPIIMYDDMILDGRNRYKACKMARVEPDFKQFKGNDPLAYVISLNLHRRHLNESQRAGVAAKIANIQNGENQHKRGSVNLPTLVSQPKAAEMLNVSPSMIRKYKAVEREAPELTKRIDSGEITVHEAQKEIKGKTLELKKEEYKKSILRGAGNQPMIRLSDCCDYLQTFKDNSIDLLFTDPPYATDVEDIAKFCLRWIPLAIKKTKAGGRMYICSGAYPQEIQAVLSVLLNQDKFIVDNPLVWTYRNTLGVTPKMKYNLNYQLIWHLYSNESKELDTSITNEMFSVQDINAPDGRIGNRLHTWQKPDELATRIVRHSTVEGDVVVDPFIGTGTFVIAASKLNRKAYGCDNNKANIKIAEDRGCIIIGK